MNIQTIKTINSAAEANAAHRRICSLLIEDCFAIGKFLLSQKAKCKHGTWSQWVKDNLEFSERTARRYMCVVRNQDILMKEPVLMATGKVEDDVKHTMEEAQAQVKTDSVSDLKPDAIRSDPVRPIKTANDAYKKLTKPKSTPAKRKVTVKSWNPLEHGYAQIEPGVFHPHGRPLSSTKTDGNKVEVWTVPPQRKNSVPRVDVTIDGLGKFPGIPLLTYPGDQVAKEAAIELEKELQTPALPELVGASVSPALIEKMNKENEETGDLQQIMDLITDSFNAWLAQWKPTGFDGCACTWILSEVLEGAIEDSGDYCVGCVKEALEGEELAKVVPIETPPASRRKI